MAALLARGPRAPRGRARASARPSSRARWPARVDARLPPHPVHARPPAERRHRRGASTTRRRPTFEFRRGPDLRARRCWPTRSTARRRARSPRCSRPWRSARSRWTARRTPLPEPFFLIATQNPIELDGHVPAARGPARPVPGEAQPRLSRRRHGGARAGGPARGAPPGRSRPPWPTWPPCSEAQAGGRAACTCTTAVIGYIQRLVAETRRHPARGLGRQPARRAGPHARGPGPRPRPGRRAT